MKYLLTILFVLNFPAMGADPLQGNWLFYKKIYRGTEMPEPPTATLRLCFVFDGNGNDTLIWWREGNSGYCRRKGRYSIQNNRLLDEVMWVDPANNRDCGQDPDMQLGRKTTTPFTVRDGEFYLELSLSNEPLYYVWKQERNICSY